MRLDSLSFIIAGVCAFLALALSIAQIAVHLANYKRPSLQRLVVRILLMVPIYAVDSWLSLRFKGISHYLDFARDTYEAFVIYTFLMLLLEFLKHYDDDVSSGVDKVFEYSLIKPITALCAMILESVGLYDVGSFSPGRGYLYISLIDNVSVFFALYYLILFYLATRHALTPFRPLGKFIVIKSVIFFSFWQGFIISALVSLGTIQDVGEWTADEVATGLQNFLICIEMLFAAIAHRYVFSFEEFATTSLMAHPDARRAKIEFPALYRNFRDVMSVRDVYLDTKMHFGRQRSSRPSRSGSEALLSESQKSDAGGMI